MSQTEICGFALRPWKLVLKRARRLTSRGVLENARKCIGVKHMFYPVGTAVLIFTAKVCQAASAGLSPPLFLQARPPVIVWLWSLDGVSRVGTTVERKRGS